MGILEQSTPIKYTLKNLGHNHFSIKVPSICLVTIERQDTLKNGLEGLHHFKNVRLKGLYRL